MRKILWALVLGVSMAAVVPAVAMARAHHHRGHHEVRHRHVHVRHEHFGSWNDEGAAAGNAPSAGKVASFNHGVLVVTLSDGSTVSGQVTSATEIKCEAAEPGETEHAQHADGDHGGGNDRADRGGDERGDRDDNNGPGDDDQNEQMCSAANLVPGASVSDAELTVNGAGAFWNEVDLGG